MAFFNNKLQKIDSSWNFGPNKESFVKVIDIIKKIKKIKKLKIKIANKNEFSETKVLKLNNSKAKRLLKWKPKLNFVKGLNLTINSYR